MGTETMARTVSADIDVDVTSGGQVVFQVAVAQADGLDIDENLTITLNGVPLPVQEVNGVTGSRFHLVKPDPGSFA